MRSDLVEAPYIDEFPLTLECKLLHTVEIGLHTQFIGEIVDTKVDERVLPESGLPDPAQLEAFVFAPECSAYHRIAGRIGQAFSIGKEI